MIETEYSLGEGVYADIVDDGLIVLRTERDGKLQLIYLERDTQVALTGLIERLRRADVESELAADRMEMSE